MIFTRAIAVLFAACLLGDVGCGAPAKSAEGETTSASKLAELKAQRRRDRARLRQLEESMAKIAAERRQSGHTPALPVQRLEPEQPQPPAPTDVVAVADDGTEIVYVGEAAQERSVVADTNLLRESPSRKARRVPPRKRRPAPASIARVPTSSDSLGVTSSRLPTVGEVTKTSPPPPRARRRANTRRPRRPGNAPASAITEYQRHVAALRAGRHKQAITGLRRFVKRHARSDYADNAQYWLGEAYYDRKMFKEALVEFERVASAYPTGNKVPDANLKAAYCKINLGDVAGARSLLRQLIAEFPNGRVADLAAEKLEHLAD